MDNPVKALDPLRFPQRLDLEVDPELYAQIERLSSRSGRSIAEIVQGLISCSLEPIPAHEISGR